MRRLPIHFKQAQQPDCLFIAETRPTLAHPTLQALTSGKKQNDVRNSSIAQPPHSIPREMSSEGFAFHAVYDNSPNVAAQNCKGVLKHGWSAQDSDSSVNNYH